MALGFVTQWLLAGPLEDYPQVENPYGVESPVVDFLTGVAVLLIVVGIAGSSASLILRFRRARGEQRQQMKWIAFAGAVAGVCVMVFTVLYDVVGEAVANIGIMDPYACEASPSRWPSMASPLVTIPGRRSPRKDADDCTDEIVPAQAEAAGPCR